MAKGTLEREKTCTNLREFVGKTVKITDSKEGEWCGEILKLRVEENEEDSVIVKLPFGHIVFWESDIRNIVTYQTKEKKVI